MSLQKIESICSNITSGGTPSRANLNYWEGGTIPWLKTGDIKKNFIYEVDEYITNSGLENSSAKIIPINSLLIAMYGDGNTAGNVAINKIRLATNQACCNLTIDPLLADYRYVYYYLKGSYNNLTNLKLGGSQQNLNSKTIKNFPINLPSLYIQRRIAAILSTYDDLIEINKKRIQVLEDMAVELYKEWFVRFRFPNWENTEFKKGVPADWNEVNLNDLGKIITGKTPSLTVSEYHDGEYPFYKTPDMHNKIFVFDTEDSLTEYGLSSQKSQIIEENSIMVTCIGTGGITAISTKKGCTNQQINSISLYDKDLLYWAFLTIRSLKPQIELFGATGTTMTNLSKGKLSRLLVFKPDLRLIKEYQNIVKPMFDKIKNLGLSNANLIKQKDVLLPRLISGKLLVDHLDIQYPPSMQTSDEAEEK